MFRFFIDLFDSLFSEKFSGNFVKMLDKALSGCYYNDNDYHY